jgi:phosphatidylinositol alpha-mannosyltransferase
VRVGIVSPYSYTYPGGVGRHAEALAAQLGLQGHEVRLLAPYDPDDRLARAAHGGASPERRPVPDHLLPLGRTVGLPMNGAVSNLAVLPSAVATLGRELRSGGYDVVHVHEPNAPLVSWYATEAARAPLVGTFHCYSANRLANGVAANVLGARRLYNKLGARIAVSEAARWTCERFYGGEYRVIPNGVDLAAALPDHYAERDLLELLFIGRADERKGLPVLLRSFEALRRAGVPARLTVAGAAPEKVEPLLLDPDGVDLVGRVSEREKWRLLGRADLLCAPSLGGESFGMVLTEAFASGTPVVASDIAGYRDVVSDGVDGVLVAPGDPAALGEALARLGLDGPRREAMAAAARQRARRFSWSRVAEEVAAVYEEVALAPAAAAGARLGRRLGLASATGRRTPPPRRLDSIEPERPRSRRRTAGRIARRAGIATAALGGVALSALALRSIGIASIAEAVVAAAPVWVLIALALMCASMLIRAEAWHAILRAALPGSRVRRRDTTRATMIGVLMSATLPARLGEPSRALILASRLGRVHERLPVVLGTVVSQTLLNILALAILGGVMLATVGGVFPGGQDALVVATIAPVIAIAALLGAPALLRRGTPSRCRRVGQTVARARAALVRVRSGLDVFRQPRLGGWAIATQLSAWAVQWLACYTLLVAFGLDDRAGLGAAAAVLFAVNVTAALPVTPSNVGVFQAACVAVLSAYGVGHADGLAYGIMLQAVEIATAFALGMPALLREGMSWRDLRLRALHSAPVQLSGIRGLGRRETAEIDA